MPRTFIEELQRWEGGRICLMDKEEVEGCRTWTVGPYPTKTKNQEVYFCTPPVGWRENYRSRTEANPILGAAAWIKGRDIPKAK